MSLARYVRRGGPRDAYRCRRRHHRRPQLTYSGISAIWRDPIEAAIADGVHRSANGVTNRVVELRAWIRTSPVPIAWPHPTPTAAAQVRLAPPASAAGAPPPTALSATRAPPPAVKQHELVPDGHAAYPLCPSSERPRIGRLVSHAESGRRKHRPQSATRSHRFCCSVGLRRGAAV